MKSLIAVITVCLIFVITQTSQVSAFSVKELLGLKKSEPESKVEEKASKKEPIKETNDSNWAKTTGIGDSLNRQIDLDYVSLLVANMNEQERAQVLSDEDLFKQVIENEANNLSTTSAAIANNLYKDRNVEFLMRRGVENILRESYLNFLIASKLPKDFPTQAQVTEYYESNKAQFVVPERIHVWQIFFAKPADADDKAVTGLQKKAATHIAEINKGKSDFSSVALAVSEHEQSRALGGYMGLLKTSELLPEIKDTILSLKETEVSKPIVSEAGVHIIRRGKIEQEQALKLGQVEQQIRQLLIKQVHAQLRQAIFRQARTEYPQTISDKKIQEWRLRLRTDTAK